jgi:hypothetical protein
MFENRTLRNIFGPKTDEVRGELRRNHEEHDLCYSLNIIRLIKSRMRRAGHVARMGDRKVAYKVSGGRLKENRQHGRPTRKWENIKKDKDVGWGAWTRLICLGAETGGRRLRMT